MSSRYPIHPRTMHPRVSHSDNSRPPHRCSRAPGDRRPRDSLLADEEHPHRALAKDTNIIRATCMAQRTYIRVSAFQVVSLLVGVLVPAVGAGRRANTMRTPSQLRSARCRSMWWLNGPWSEGTQHANTTLRRGLVAVRNLSLFSFFGGGRAGGGTSACPRRAGLWCLWERVR